MDSNSYYIGYIFNENNNINSLETIQNILSDSKFELENFKSVEQIHSPLIYLGNLKWIWDKRLKRVFFNKKGEEDSKKIKVFKGGSSKIFKRKFCDSSFIKCALLIIKTLDEDTKGVS